MTVDEVAARLSTCNERMLVITGGEPMLQQKALRQLTRLLHAEGWFTEVETAGTVVPETVELARHFNVSPKLSNSGNALGRRYVPAALDVLNCAPSRAFKFVITRESDLEEVDELVSRHGLSPIYIMPEGITPDDIKNTSVQIAPAVIGRGYKLTTRLHVAIYGTRRGV